MARFESDFIQRENKLTSEVEKLRMEKDGIGL